MYVKVFDRILSSSLWDNDSDTRIVWFTLLLLADQNGNFTSTRGKIARDANVSLEATNRALDAFLAPDAESTTDDDDGRRLEYCGNNTWHVINKVKYNDFGKQEQIRAQTAIRVQRYKQRKKGNAEVTQGNAPVTVGNAEVTQGLRPVAIDVAIDITTDVDQEGSEDIHSRKPDGLPTRPAKSKQDIQTLFDFWCQVMEHPNAKLGPKRQRRIEWALKNYGLERSQRAIIGCAASPFHMGDNKDGKRFDDLELIFRNEEKFEAFEIQGQKATVEVNSETKATRVIITKAANDVRAMTVEQESAMYAAMLDKKRQQKPSGIIIENQYAPCQFPQITDGE